jgi:chromosome segregation ATPase
MKLVIATGCPCTGWEVVVPILTDAGLETGVDAVSGWQDRLLVASGVEDPLQLRQALQPDMAMQEELTALLTDDQSDSERLVVSRCPWLLDFWGARCPDAQFLLFFRRAETAVAQALMCGIEPIRFLKDWEATTRYLIRFQRRYRQRTLLLSAEAAKENPHRLVEATRTIGLTLNLSTESVSRESPAVGETERFLAQRLMAGNPSIGALEIELAARAQPLGDLPSQATEVALNDLLKCYLQTRRDLEQLRSQLNHVQCDFERVLSEKKTIEGTHAATGVQLEEFKARAAHLEQACGELEGANQSLELNKREVLDESNLLIEQLHEVQEELEKIFLEKQQLEQAQAATDVELRQVRSQAAQVDRAREEAEITNQSLEASKREVLEENTLLIGQLHEVQEKLEKLFLEKQQLEQAQAATDVELRQVRSQAAQVDRAREEAEITNQSLEASKREVLEENTLLIGQLHEVQEKLEKLFLEKQQLGQAQAATSGELQQARARMALLEKAREELEVSNQSLETHGNQVLEENGLLLKQLHQVQEELEIYFLKYHETLSSQDPLPEEQAPEMEESSELVAEPQQKAPQREVSAWTNQKLIQTLFQPFKRPDKKRDKLRRQLEVLNQSGLFEQEWYLSAYPDVASAGVDPTEHYVRFGAAEGRNPSPSFDTAYYLQSNPDVAAAGVNPLLHYIKFGISEGRKACSEKTRF